MHTLDRKAGVVGSAHHLDEPLGMGPLKGSLGNEPSSDMVS